MIGIELAERGLVPDALIRLGIRRMLRQKQAEIGAGGVEAVQARKSDFVAALRESPVALVPERANEQHYEVPAAFFEQVLGRRLKYSCGWFDPGVRDLDVAEEAMLRRTCERARIANGMRVLDLGCGWGSLTLFVAEHFPDCRVLAVSNSKTQREHILRQCDERGLDNVEVRVADANVFAPEPGDGAFDRVVSIEMFEHMRNYGVLMSRIASWLAPGGRLFVHVFCHRSAAYPYETEGSGNWMGRHFFTGGLMPSQDLLLHFQDDLRLESRWSVGGEHYCKTSEAWLARLDERRETLLPVLAGAYGEAEARLWLQRWRMFFMACAELFGYAGGDEWFVAHYRFARREDRS